MICIEVVCNMKWMRLSDILNTFSHQDARWCEVWPMITHYETGISLFNIWSEIFRPCITNCSGIYLEKQLVAACSLTIWLKLEKSMIQRQGFLLRKFLACSSWCSRRRWTLKLANKASVTVLQSCVDARHKLCYLPQFCSWVVYLSCHSVIWYSTARF